MPRPLLTACAWLALCAPALASGTLAVSPPAFAASTTSTSVKVVKSGNATDWTTSAPAFSVSSVTGVSFSSVVVVDANTATFTVTTLAGVGVGTIADATSTATGTLIVGSLVVKDTFVGANGSNLTAHAPSPGGSGTWTADVGAITLDGSGSTVTGGAGGFYHESHAATTTTVCIQGTLNLKASPAQFQALGLYDAGTGNHYEVLTNADATAGLSGAATAAGATGFLPGSGFAGTSYAAGTPVPITLLYSVSGALVTLRWYQAGKLVETNVVASGAYTGLKSPWVRNASPTASTTGADWSNLLLLDLGATGSISASPAIFASTVAGGSPSNVVKITGAGTAWTGGEAAGLTNAGGTNAAITGSQYVDATNQAIYCQVDAGTVAGTASLSVGPLTCPLTISAAAPANELLIFGDSLAANGARAASTAAAILGPTWRCEVLGTFAATVRPSGLQEPWGSIAAHKLSGRNVLVHIGTDNDYVGGATAAQVYAYLRDVQRPALQSAGWLVVLTTEIPYPATTSWTPQIAAYNALVRANALADGFDGLSDVAAAAAFADPLSNYNPNVFGGDFIHPSNGGNDVIGRRAAAVALDAIHPPTGGGGGRPRQPQGAFSIPRPDAADDARRTPPRKAA